MAFWDLFRGTPKICTACAAALCDAHAVAQLRTTFAERGCEFLTFRYPDGSGHGFYS
jgi:hypothetical protein